MYQFNLDQHTLKPKVQQIKQSIIMAIENGFLGKKMNVRHPSMSLTGNTV